MTHEMAEKMSGPTGTVARALADAALGEYDRWATHAVVTDTDAARAISKRALGDLRADLEDYLAHELVSTLTMLQLLGQIEIKESTDV